MHQSALHLRRSRCSWKTKELPKRPENRRYFKAAGASIDHDDFEVLSGNSKSGGITNSLVEIIHLVHRRADGLGNSGEYSFPS